MRLGAPFNRRGDRRDSRGRPTKNKQYKIAFLMDHALLSNPNLQWIRTDTLADGTTVKTFVMTDVFGRRRYVSKVVRPGLEPIVLEYEPGEGLIEHGWRHGAQPDPESPILYMVYLGNDQESYYSGDGDRYCSNSGPFTHIYGKADPEQAPDCTTSSDIWWPPPPPEDDHESIIDQGPFSTFETYSDRNPAMYSGVARVCAQGKGASADIVIDLNHPQLTGVSPFYDGIIRYLREPGTNDPLDPGDLIYWRIKVASGGVAAARLYHSADVQPYVDHLVRGTLGDGSSLTDDVKARYEAVVTNTLKAQDAEGEYPTPIQILDGEVFETLIGEEGFSFYDGHPFFSPQPWGTGYENDPRCVLTDIRRRYDLGTSVDDPWEMATTIELSFAFGSAGIPSCVAGVLDKSKWWPRASSAYIYASYEIQGRNYSPQLCQVFAMSVVGNCPSAERAVVCAFYDVQGRLLKLEQEPGTIVSASTFGDDDMRIGIRRAESPWYDDSAKPVLKSSATRYTSYSAKDNSWSVAGETIEAVNTSYGSKLERSISGGPGNPVDHVSQPNPNNGFVPNASYEAPYCIDAVRRLSPNGSCSDSYWAEVLWPLVTANPDNRVNYTNVGTRRVYKLNAIEREVSTDSSSTSIQVYVVRPGPARDVVFVAKSTTETIGEQSIKEWEPANEGAGGVQYRVALVNSDGTTPEGGTNWAVSYHWMEPEWFDILPHANAGPDMKQKSTTIRDGIWDPYTYNPPYDQGYITYGAANRCNELTSNTTVPASSNTQYTGGIYGSVAKQLSNSQLEDALIDFSAPTTDMQCMDALVRLSVSAQGSMVGHLTDFSQINEGGFDSAPISGAFVGWA